MTLEPIAAPSANDCWNRIGIAGDRSCPELVQHIHCRNCPVFAAAAIKFFDRPAPEGYLAEWADLLAAPLEPVDNKDVSLLIFRLGEEWLALRTLVIVEVTATRWVHRIPHRSDDRLVGLVNLRGQLQLQVSLHGVLGIDLPAARSAGDPSVNARLVVVKRDGLIWVFEADEVRGVYRFARTRFSNVPSTLANPAHGFSQAVVSWRERRVGYLNDQRVFEALKGLSQ